MISQDVPLPPIACVQEHRSEPAGIFRAPSIPSLAMHSQAAPSATDASLLAKLCALKSVVGPLAISGLEQASMDASGIIISWLYHFTALFAKILVPYDHETAFMKFSHK